MDCHGLEPRRLVETTAPTEFCGKSNIIAKTALVPVEHRILFKVLLMTFKIVNDCAQEYLSDFLETYVPTRSLRSATFSSCS